jgi:hypothetical protein
LYSKEHLYIFCDTQMARKPGRPQKDQSQAKSRPLNLRLSAGEKEAFQAAASAAGLDLSAWVRERLRQVARKELRGLGLPVSFDTR